MYLMENNYSEQFKKDLDLDDWNCFIRGWHNPQKLLKLVSNNPMNNKYIAGIDPISEGIVK